MISMRHWCIFANRRWKLDLVFATLLITCLGCESGDVPPLNVTEVNVTEVSGPADDHSIIQFCADCHKLPDPANFEKDRWPEEVEQGIRIYRKSGRQDLTIPDVEATITFFRQHAPTKIVFDPPDRVKDTRFKQTTVDWPDQHLPVAISSIEATNAEDELPEYILTDMWTGALTRLTVTADDVQIVPLGTTAHPAKLTATHADDDDQLDYLVADLGTLNPQSEKHGSVWLLRGSDSDTYQRIPLKLGLSRVADIQPIDHDNDGDMDLIAADFGLHFVGSIYLGTNNGSVDGNPQFDWSVIDPRPGAISLPTLDFNADGRTDFFALIAQHYETIELHLNKGDGRFEKTTVFEQGDPASGSSSMEMVDFDFDGDLDLIYTNGDTFDDGLAKPNHGIKWLRNDGSFPFTAIDVAKMPGCYHAVPGDIDGDGDMDIAAVSYLSQQEIDKYPDGTFDGISWFEQTADGNFIRHSILTNVCEAATCSLIDWDLDGDLDLFVPPTSADRQANEGCRLYINQQSPPTDDQR